MKLSSVVTMQPRLGDFETQSKRYTLARNVEASCKRRSAYRAYLRWGWRKVARLRPGWDDAPMFDVLILTLDQTYK